MSAVLFRSLGTALVVAGSCLAATFGTVVPVRGTVSDIALDESRGRLYAANFSAYRVEVIDTAAKALLAPITVSAPPSAVAVSPDNRYLVIGEYQKPASGPLGGFLRDTGGLTIVDLSTNFRVHLDLTAPVVAVAFGADGQALVVTRSPTPPAPPPPPPPTTPPTPPPPPPAPGPNVFLLDPASAAIDIIGTVPIVSQDLPLVPPLAGSVSLATFPPQIIQTGVGISGDRQRIVVLASPEFTLITYDVASRSIVADAPGAAVPPLGPRTVSMNQDGSTFVAGWALFGTSVQAQFPQPNGAYERGSHAWDLKRNLIYAQIPAPGDGPVLHIADTDNLTIRERLQLAEELAGKSVMSSDMNTMYSASVSGVTILPVGQLVDLPQVSTVEEDLLFQGDACNAGVITRTLDLTSLGSSPADFKLSLPDGVTGVRLLTTSGTTPAQVQIQVDPSAFQGVKGTSRVMLNITSTAAVNLPPAVRLLINTRDFNQKGQIVNIPGKLVDLLADPARSRLYILRQDRNLVLIYDMATLGLIGSLRTGNTPTGMSMTTDSQFLIVGNDNSQIANVFDLNNLIPTAPILFFADYPRTIGVSATDIFATVRTVNGPDHLDHINFSTRLADTPITLSGAPDPAIYSNKLPSPDGALAESPDHTVLLLVLPDGNVVEYDSSAQTWVASRKDLSGLKGAHGPLTDNLFLADSNILDAALVSIAQLPASEGTSSGMGLLAGAGLRTTASSSSGAGLIERIDLTHLQAYNATAMAEAPLTQESLLTPEIGQIGESILPFTRTLAVSPDQSKIFALTISGLTVLGSNFDAPTPAPFISNIVNAADFKASVAPGGDVQINGGGFAPGPVSAGAPPLPTELGNVCATVNDIALPLFSVSSSQLTAQLPFSVAGSGSLVVRAPGGISKPFAFTIQSFAPAIFFNGTAGDQTGLAKIIRDDNGELVDFTNPLHPRLPITIYLTGLGLTSPLPALGAAAPASPPDTVNAPPTVTLGAATLAVTFAGLVAGEVGVYQINATVPNRVPIGTSVPLTIQQGGFSTTVQVRVVSP